MGEGGPIRVNGESQRIDEIAEHLLTSVLKTYSATDDQFGVLSQTRKLVLTHSIAVSYLHPRRAGTGTSAFRSISSR